MDEDKKNIIFEIAWPVGEKIRLPIK